MVHLSGLDVSEVAGLRDAVPRRSEPSPLYQGAWDEIERARAILGRELNDEMSKWAGFVRATWFSYRRKGNIPLSVLDHLLRGLGLRYDLAVRPAKGYVRTVGGIQGAGMPQDTEEARQAADAINGITDPGFRAKLANKVLVEALKYKKSTAPQDPQMPAEQTK